MCFDSKRLDKSTHAVFAIFFVHNHMK